MEDELALTTEEITHAAHPNDHKSRHWNLYVGERIAKAQLDKPMTKVCPECEGEKQQSIQSGTYHFDCPTCLCTGKITKTIREIVEEWKGEYNEL